VTKAAVEGYLKILNNKRAHKKSSDMIDFMELFDEEGRYQDSLENIGEYLGYSWESAKDLVKHMENSNIFRGIIRSRKRKTIYFLDEDVMKEFNEPGIYRGLGFR